MLEPEALLETARLLLREEDETSSASLRRAVSTAYYAVFHAVLKSGADRFIGADQRTTGAYGVLYRAYTHTKIADVCRLLQREVLTADRQRQLDRKHVGKAVQSIAWAFLELQDRRNSADYDPIDRESVTSANQLVRLAETTTIAWATLDDAERLAILTLMLLNTRR